MIWSFAMESERARPRAGARRRAAAAVGLRPTSLRCSVAWPAAELASFAALTALKQAAASQMNEARMRALATRPALLGAADARRRTPARGLAWECAAPCKVFWEQAAAFGSAWKRAAHSGIAGERRAP